jgi:hypothetical protein
MMDRASWQVNMTGRVSWQVNMMGRAQNADIFLMVFLEVGRAAPLMGDERMMI